MVMTFLKVFSFLYGILIGSFINVVILRMPKDESVVLPASACLSCGHKIKWYENLPIISYLCLKGKCSACETPISIQYPLVEFVVGLHFLLFSPIGLEMPDIINSIFINLTFCIFLAIFIIDLRHYIIPNQLNVCLFLMFTLWAILNDTFVSGAIGAAAGFLFPLLITYLFYKIRGVVGLGGGDIKLWGALGMYLGLQGVFFNIFLSCFLGAVLGMILIVTKKLDRNKPFAFGPAIIIISYLQIVFPDLFNQVIAILIS